MRKPEMRIGDFSLLAISLLYSQALVFMLNVFNGGRMGIRMPSLVVCRTL